MTINSSTNYSQQITAFLIEYYGGVIKQLTNQTCIFKCDSFNQARCILKSLKG